MSTDELPYGEDRVRPSDAPDSINPSTSDFAYLQVDEAEVDCPPVLGISDTNENQMAYSLGRTLGSMWLLATMGNDLPHDWALDLDAPIDNEWHAVMNNWMADYRKSSDAHATTYLKRLAILVWNFYARWDNVSPRVRKGTAWCMLRIGLLSHAFVAHDERAAYKFLCPAEDFFERYVKTHDGLAIHLERAFSHNPSRAYRRGRS